MSRNTLPEHADKSQIVILPWHSNPRLLSTQPECHKGTRSIQPWVPLKSSLVPLLFLFLVVILPHTSPCCTPWLMYAQPPVFRMYTCLLFSQISFMRPVPIKLYKLPCHVCFCSSNIEYVLPFLLNYSKVPSRLWHSALLCSSKPSYS